MARVMVVLPTPLGPEITSSRPRAWALRRSGVGVVGRVLGHFVLARIPMTGGELVCWGGEDSWRAPDAEEPMKRVVIAVAALVLGTGGLMASTDPGQRR